MSIPFSKISQCEKTGKGIDFLSSRGYNIGVKGEKKQKE